MKLDPKWQIIETDFSNYSSDSYRSRTRVRLVIRAVVAKISIFRSLNKPFWRLFRRKNLLLDSIRLEQYVYLLSKSLQDAFGLERCEIIFSFGVTEENINGTTNDNFKNRVRFYFFLLGTLLFLRDSIAACSGESRNYRRTLLVEPG